MTARFEGTFTLLVTPFDSAGAVDPAGYARLVEHHLTAGAQGLFAVCGTSEMAALTLDERLDLAREAARRAAAAGGTVPVVAAANLEVDPEAQGDEVARVSQTGVDGVVLVPPRRHGGDPQALFAYFAGLARRSAVPVLLYEWPGSSPSHIPAPVFGRLAADIGIAGIKDTTCTRDGIAAKVAAAAAAAVPSGPVPAVPSGPVAAAVPPSAAAARPEATVFQANTPLLLDALAAGARGSMTIASAARPDLLAALWAAHAAGRAGEAALLHREAVFLDAVIGPCHPAGAKWLLCREGVLSGFRTRLGRAPGDADIQALTAWARQAPARQGR